MANEFQHLKTYHFVLSSVLFILGLIVLISFQGTFRYLGLILILGTLIYFSVILYLGFRQSDQGTFKSQTREQILRHQHRK
jgi:hypothetical protein